MALYDKPEIVRDLSADFSIGAFLVLAAFLAFVRIIAIKNIFKKILKTIDKRKSIEYNQVNGFNH